MSQFATVTVMDAPAAATQLPRTGGAHTELLLVIGIGLVLMGLLLLSYERVLEAQRS